MNRSSPVPAALMQPQTMMLPSPCLTVGKAHFSWYSSPGRHHTCWTPSESNKFILVSSDHSNSCSWPGSLQQTVCRLFCEPASEEASFWDNGHANRLVAVCGVWSEHWQADLPLLQPLKQCWQHSCVCFLKPASAPDARVGYRLLFFDTGAKSILLKRCRCRNGAWTDTCYIYTHTYMHTYIHTYIHTYTHTHTHTVYGTNEAPGNPQCGQRHCYSCNWVNRRYKVLNDKTNTLNTRLRQYIVCLCYSSHLWYFHNN